MRPITSRFAALGVVLLLAAGCEPAGDGTAAEDPGDDGEAVTATERTSSPRPSPQPPPAASPGPGADGEAPEEVAIAASVVATGLEAPWELVFADGRAFVTERDTGAVRELDEAGRAEEVARLAVEPAGEGGLLGLAEDPRADGLGFYAYITTAQDNRVVRFAPGGEPEPVVTGIPSGRTHNGGRVAVGPDGMLWVGTGDAGEAALAQDPASLAGKILRYTVDGDIPDDNPTAGSPVWSLGHRNVQGLAWTGDGALYAAEFGPDVDDEINRVEPGGNYGWPEVTGEAGVDGFVDPLFVRQPAEASWSGLAALDGGAIPQWEGNLFAAALRGERLWRLQLGDGGAVVDSEELLVGEIGRIRQVVQAPDGSLWLLTSNRDGRGRPAEEDDRVVRLGPAG